MSGLSLQPNADQTVILAGNSIGSFGNVRIGNWNAGIKLNDVQKALIGQASGAPNVISGNGGDGILIAGANSTQNTISNSTIGTNETGSLGLGNIGNGINISGGGGTLIGGNAAEGNLISGNGANGIL